MFTIYFTTETFAIYAVTSCFTYRAKEILKPSPIQVEFTCILQAFQQILNCIIIIIIFRSYYSTADCTYANLKVSKNSGSTLEFSNVSQ